jgi:carboxyvinyl-carboxyphosphonate phosphorylmutase
VQAMHDCLKALREGTPPAQLEGVASNELMQRLTRDADYRKWRDDYLG